MSELKNCAHCGGIAELIECDAGFQVMCSGCDLGLVSDDWTKEAAIERWNTRANDGWISVGDELPRMLQSALISITNDCVEGGVSEAMHQMNGEFIMPSEFARNKMNARPCVGVTHWMPLPEPPNEDRKNDNQN